MKDLSDREITRRCAKAMGYEIVSNDPNWTGGPVRTEVAHHEGTIMIRSSRVLPHTYKPLHDDAQAMALVKKLELEIGWYTDGRAAVHHPDGDANWIADKDLNRAIVTCVARIRRAEREGK